MGNLYIKLNPVTVLFLTLVIIVVFMCDSGKRETID